MTEPAPLLELADVDMKVDTQSPEQEPRYDGRLEMDQEEIDAIIRNKRKVRDPKACYACHRRKVKCDRNLPCDSCVKRDHPELCSYERPSKKRKIVLNSGVTSTEHGEGAEENSLDTVSVPREEWGRMNRELARLRQQINDEKERRLEEQTSAAISQADEGDREGVHAPSNQMGTMHLGSRSVLAYMLGSRSKSTQGAARTLLEQNILPNLGLDNETTTYPFVDLWSTDQSIQDVSGLMKALPDDNLCREFWWTYRDIPCTIYPVVADAEAFESTLTHLLKTRAEFARTGGELDPDRPYEVSMPWLALLFAVLASGSQSTGRAAKERELTSQVYICCSYQALRMANFLTHPSLETIQALLIIGNALSYNMNPGVAYILLGMTLRSAFSMGLHVQSAKFSEHENYLRARVWWALAWQDSHFSVSYDRPSSSILCWPDIPQTKRSGPGRRSYCESMTQVIKLTQEIIRLRTYNHDGKAVMSWSSIAKFKDDMHKIWQDALPRLRDRSQCTAMTEHLERLALKLHCSYMISEICRPALKENSVQPSSTSPLDLKKRKNSASDLEVISSLRAECVKYLESTVDTYVELRGISRFAARSWIGIQRSISAAFLLGILPETKQEPRIIQSLLDLQRGIEESAIQDSGFSREVGSPEIQRSILDTKDSPLWIRSMTKTLSALSKLNAALGGITDVKARNGKPHFAAINANGNMNNSVNSGLMSPVPSYQHMYNLVDENQGGSLEPHIPHLSYNYDPFTPGSSSSNSAGDSWNQANIAERALEYVQPGLWG